jgi:acyl transferase domain-containing protein
MQILGSAINSGGSAAPVNAPIAEAQADAMQQAFYGTGRAPAEVDFVELHATGIVVDRYVLCFIIYNLSPPPISLLP